MVRVKKSVTCCSDAILDAFSKEDTATVHEAMGQRGAMEPDIKPMVKGMRICGRAVTVCCHAGDNIMLIKAMSMGRKGDVIVADMGRIESSGCFGEVLATECLVKGIAGLIVTGSVRDSVAVAAAGFPVFSKNLSICGTSKATLGTINFPICCGGVVVNPGDIILADDDGVVVIPPEESSEILDAVKARKDKEAAVMERLRNGESLWDIYNYQKIFDALHCTEEK